MKKILLGLLLAVGAAGGAWLLASGASGTKNPLAAAGSPLQLVGNGFGAPEYELSDLRYFRLAAHKVTQDYVAPERVDAEAMLDKALERVARVVPEFLFEPTNGGRGLRIVVGAESTEISVPELDTLAQLTSVISEVTAFLDARMDESIDAPSVEYALMNGMLATLDPHSVYIDPESFREMSITNRGHFGGLGITIGVRENRLTILYPLRGTPAWEAGLKAGDRIDRIGDESTVNMTLQEAVSKLRGEEGTDVTITVSDADSLDRVVTVTRARISVPSVEHTYAGDGVGLIQMGHFAQDTFDRLEEALEELEEAAWKDKQGELKGIVLDLRQNPGGYLDQAKNVANKFLRSGVIVSTEGLGQRDKDVMHASRFGTEDQIAVVVLVDEGSASASEIVAGALQQQGRAPVIGVRTFGKGSVQNLYDQDFHDGALKLTIAQYLTPGDVSIQGVGVRPDIELRPARVEADEDGEIVQLYWQDFELREEDYETSFAWGTANESKAAFAAVYACPDCWDTEDTARDDLPADHLEDMEVQVAKALILEAGGPKAAPMLAKAPEVVGELVATKRKELEQSLRQLGIDWSAAPKHTRPNKAAVSVQVEIGSDDGYLTPGIETPVTLTVTNSGDAPIFRLRAVTEGDMFSGNEYVFGRLDAGESRTFSVSARPATWLTARTEEVHWHFFADGSEPPPPFTGRLRVKDVPHPRFAYSYQVLDDGTGRSRGNGDGLIQPGEAIDLLVRVRNTGAGATSDLWLASLGEATEATEAAEATDAPEPPAGNGFIRLKNKSGQDLFLVDGTHEFSLKTDGEVEARLHFTVSEAMAGEAISAELTVGDSRFWEIVTTDVKLPLYSPSEPVAAVERRMKPKEASASVRGGASELSPIVGSIEGPVDVDGRLGNWFRVQTPWGGPGWVDAAAVTAVGRKDDVAEISAVYAHSPPVIRLANNPGGSVVVADELRLVGEVVDDQSVVDLFVFVEGRKRSYQRVESTTGTHAFELVLPLVPGENTIEIQARDAQDHRGKLTFGVYRETATASVQPAANDAVLR